MENNTPNQPTKFEKLNKIKDSSSKSLAIFGLIAILGLLSYGIIKVAPVVIRGIASAAVSLSSIFIPANNLTATLSSTTINSGDSFQMQWTLDSKNNDQGSYTISYPCIDGAHIEVLARASNDVIFCNTASHFLNNNNSLSLAGFNTKQGSVELPITIHFTRNGESSESAQVTQKITIVGNPAVTGNTTVTPPATNTTPNRPSANTGRPTGSYDNVYLIPGTGTVAQNNPNGYVDLTARILETGYISTTTNAFIAAPEVKLSQRPAIRFEIVNNGTKRATGWTFAAVLPTYPSYIFQSEGQPDLNPGDKIQFTIAFDSIMQKPVVDFTINVDPLSSVMEPNKTNNIIRGKMYLNLAN